MLMPERDGYKGIEDDAVWRQEAKNRIEKYRKEDILIEVRIPMEHLYQMRRLKLN